MGQKREVSVGGQEENWHWRCRLLLQCSPSSSSLGASSVSCRDPSINLHSSKEVWSIPLYPLLLNLAPWILLRALICRDDCCKEAISPSVEAVPCTAHCATEVSVLQWLKQGQVGKSFPSSAKSIAKKHVVTALLRHKCTLGIQADPVSCFPLYGKLLQFCPVFIFISISVYDFSCILLRLGLSNTSLCFHSERMA